MPRRADLRSICLIGSGPIVIGQAAEFDYAGCQALKVLREDGYRTIVINSNPATIMTDPGFADRTYLEPLDLEGVVGVLRRERPGCPAADDGRRHRPQPRARARRRRDPRRTRDRADRRADRGDPARRGSRALQADGRRLRPQGADVAHRHVERRSGRDLAARGRPPGVHARRSRRRLRRHARAAAPPGRCAASPSRRSRRCSSRNRCAAGTSSSSRSCATEPTTS